MLNSEKEEKLRKLKSIAERDPSLQRAAVLHTAARADPHLRVGEKGKRRPINKARNDDLMLLNNFMSPIPQ